MKTTNNTTTYLHIIEPDKIINNFQFLSIKDFLKKKKTKLNDIFIGDLLEYFSNETSIEIFNNIVKRLDTNKKIYIQGTDIRSVVNSFSMDEINETIFNMLVFGNGKKQTVSFYKIKAMIDSIPSLDIVAIKFMNSVNYYIECVKK